MSDANLTRDHIALDDTFAARRYFKKFDVIIGHLSRVAARMLEERRFTKDEVAIISRYIGGLSLTFGALATKYLMSGREAGAPFGALSFDAHDSGFPVFRELLTMANDAQQARKHLAGMPTPAAIKDEMIRMIVGELAIPTRLQFAMSQRLYYEMLQDGEFFWAQNDPEGKWLEKTADGRHRYLLHWAAYDSQVNLPTIYLMEVEDTGGRPMPRDERRWPAVQRHLSAQSLGGLKLLTIAQGFDTDFDDLHPKWLKRIHVGPMYSSAYTMQAGPIHDVLNEANAPAGQDWALAWTVEELESERTQIEKSGWFGTVERQIFALDPFAGRGADTGATRTERSIILPERPFQVLEEKRPPGFQSVRKFVVSQSGRVLSYA